MTRRRLIGQLVLVILWLTFLVWLASKLLHTAGKYVDGKFPTHFGESLLENQAWFVGHIATGVAVLFIGPLQFLKFIRDRYRRFHRVLGRIYVVASLVSILCLFVNILPNGECSSCKPSNYVVTLLWLLSVVAAWLSIRVRDIETHRAFMMRSFLFAAYFIAVRTYADTMMTYLPGKPGDAGQYANSDWLTWTVPLILLEIYLFTSRYLKRRAGRRADMRRS